jgi:hypothetical protein
MTSLPSRVTLGVLLITSCQRFMHVLAELPTSRLDRNQRITFVLIDLTHLRRPVFACLRSNSMCREVLPLHDTNILPSTSAALQ